MSNSSPLKFCDAMMAVADRMQRAIKFAESPDVSALRKMEDALTFVSGMKAMMDSEDQRFDDLARSIKDAIRLTKDSQSRNRINLSDMVNTAQNQLGMAKWHHRYKRGLNDPSPMTDFKG